MKLTPNDKFEIKAKAFEKMRWMLAPGKDQKEGPAREVREQIWWEWCDKYDAVCKHLIDAVEELL